MASSEEEIFKRQRKVTKKDELGSLFADQRNYDYSDSESDDLDDNLHLQDIFGTGHEYDEAFAEEEEETKETVQKQIIEHIENISISDSELYTIFTKYLDLNRITDHHIVAKLLEGHDINFIALHCFESKYEKHTFNELVRIQKVLQDFPPYIKIRENIMKNKESTNFTETHVNMMDNINSLYGMKQMALYLQYSDESLPFLLSADKFSENIFLNEIIHENNGRIDLNIVEDLYKYYSVRNHTVKYPEYLEIVIDYLQKMSHNPILIESLHNSTEESIFISRLFKLLTNKQLNENNMTTSDKFYELIIRKIISSIDPRSKNIDCDNEYFTNTVDFILNKAVKTPVETDLYFTLTEKDSNLFLLVTDYMGNSINHFILQSRDLIILQDIIIEYSPTYIFATSNNKNFKFFYSRLLEIVARINYEELYKKQQKNFKIECMLIDTLLENTSAIYNEKFEIPNKVFCKLSKAELTRIYNMLLHVARRAIYPEIELMYMVKKALLPIYCNSSEQSDEKISNFWGNKYRKGSLSTNRLTKTEKLECIRRGITFSIAITGFDVNYLTKNQRLRQILSFFIDIFDNTTLEMITEIGSVSNLELLKEYVIDMNENKKIKETYSTRIFANLSTNFTKMQVGQDEVVYQILTTYLRVFPQIFKTKDSYSVLDSLLTHPTNYHKTKMICAAYDNRQEVPEGEDINQIIEQCLADKSFIDLIELDDERKDEVLAHCALLCYNRAVFKGLDDYGVFEMFNSGYDLEKIYNGTVIKCTDDIIIVVVKENEQADLNTSKSLIPNSTSQTNENGREWTVIARKNQEAGQEEEFYPNDQIKVKMTERSIVGLSFRGIIVDQKDFFLSKHPLYHECNSAQSESILKSKNEALLLRKNSSGQYGVIVYNLNNEIFLHSKVAEHKGKILFKEVLYDDVDQLIFNYFRNIAKNQAIIESDPKVKIRYLPDLPGYFEASKDHKTIVVVLDESFKVGKTTFDSWDHLKSTFGLE